MESDKNYFEDWDNYIKSSNLNNRYRVPSGLYSKDSSIVIPIYKLNIYGKIGRQLFEICLCHSVNFINAVIIKAMHPPSTWIVARIIDKRLQICVDIKLRTSQILLIPS